MKYICDKGHSFNFPAKQTRNHYDPWPEIEQNGLTKYGNFIESFTETHVCPFCSSLNLSEAPEPAEPQTEAVYVYDLTTGAQTELAGLLAQGYIIKNRYLKQYHLEKPKVEAKSPVEGVGCSNWSGKTE